MTVEFPVVEHEDVPAPFSVIFFAEDAPVEQQQENGGARAEADAEEFRSGGGDASEPLIAARKRGRNGIDPELGLDNLCEAKHNMMTRNARAMDIDRRLQPNPAIRDALESIIKVGEFISFRSDFF